MEKLINKIILRGHEYATPKTESVEISNQGVLCASAGPGPTPVSGVGGSFKGLGSENL